MEGQFALITGGSRGIGRATCLRLARAGCNICIDHYNSSDLADTLREEIEALGVRAFAFQADVSDEASFEGLLGAVRTTTATGVT